MAFKLSNMKLVEGSSFWEHFRGVEVKSIDISHGRTGAYGIHDYSIIPTFKEHKFMRVSGFSQYYYDARIDTVESNLDGTTTIHTKSNILKVEMTKEQLDQWKEFAGGYIEFINTDGTEDTDCIKAKEDDFNEWFATLGK